MLKRYFSYSSRIGILIASFVAMLLTGYLFVSQPIGADLIDVLPRYGLNDVSALMEQYGDDGRQRYLMASALWDTLFVVSYVTLFAGLIYRYCPLPKLKVLAYLPLVAGLLDLAENGQIMAMLQHYPDLTAVQVEVASLFTQLKHLLTRIYTAIALVFVVLGVFRFARRRSNLKAEEPPSSR